MFYAVLDTTDKRLLRRQERLERHARDLRELAAIGMELARITNRQTAVMSDEPGVLGEISLAFARVSRTVRQTMALEAEVEDAIIDLENPVSDQPSAPKEQSADPITRTPPAQPTPAELATQVKAIIGGGIVANAPRQRREDLLGDLDDYLDDDRLQADFAGLTVSEIIARISRDLGFERDMVAQAKAAQAANAIATGEDDTAPIEPFAVAQPHSPLAALVRLGQHPMPRTVEAVWGIAADG